MTETLTAPLSSLPVGIDPEPIGLQLRALNWASMHAELDAQGWAIAPNLLTHAEADQLAGL